MAPKSSIIALVLLVSASTVMCNEGGIGGGNNLEGHHKDVGHREEGGLGGLMNGFGRGFDFKNLFNGLGGKEEGKELPEKKIAEKEVGKGDSKEGFLGAKGPLELVKLLLNPIELINKIAAFFKLEKLGLVEIIGKGVTFGIEVALQPALISIKIIEKVFVPDTCKLKFVCELGKPAQVLKASIPKFSPGLLDGSSTLKALNDGIQGHDCEHLYPCDGELKLKKEYDLLKEGGKKLGSIKEGLSEAFSHGGNSGNSEHYSHAGSSGSSEHFEGEFAASNPSLFTVNKDGELSGTARPNASQ